MTSIWDELETPLKPDLDPRVFVEPKDKLPDSEDERQATFVSIIRKTSPGIDVTANTNAAKRSQWAAAKVKREGLTTGRNDLDVKWPEHLAIIEFKNGTKMPEPAQVEYLNRMVEFGFPVAVIRTPDRGLEWLASLGAPVRGRVSA